MKKEVIRRAHQNVTENGSLEEKLVSWRLRNAISGFSRRWSSLGVNVEDYVRDFTKPEYAQSVSPTQYKIKTYGPESINYGGRILFHDAPFTIRLYCSEDDPLACLGFDVLKGRVIDIQQIQGKNGKQEELSKIKWERMLLNMTLDWARKKGFREARILPAHRSDWKERVPIERLKRRYDTLAKRSGFTYDSELESYRLQLMKK